MKTLLLTGATGLVGGGVLRRFCGSGWRVIMATSTSNVVSNHPLIELISFNLDAVAGNDLMKKAMTRVDAVVHAAGLLPSSGLLNTREGRNKLYTLNSQGSYELMEMAANSGVEDFIFISTANMFNSKAEEIHEQLLPEPNNEYELSKIFGEMVADFFGRISSKRFYSLRISAPYGYGWSARAVIPIFLERASVGKPLKLYGTGKREQTFTHVDDIASACEDALNSGCDGTYNIAGPTVVTMVELAEAILNAFPNTKSYIEYTGKADPGESVKRRVLIDKAQREIGYRPTYNIVDGILETVATSSNPPVLFKRK